MGAGAVNGDHRLQAACRSSASPRKTGRLAQSTLCLRAQLRPLLFAKLAVPRLLLAWKTAQREMEVLDARMALANQEDAGPRFPLILAKAEDNRAFIYNTHHAPS